MAHLAQLNIARMLAPLDDPQMFGFVSELDRINALGDGSPGFVWRLQTDEGDATALRPFPDPDVIVNLTVWESVESLRAFAYQGDHLASFRQRRQWFEERVEPMVVLWWIDDGSHPDRRGSEGATRVPSSSRTLAVGLHVRAMSSPHSWSNGRRSTIQCRRSSSRS